MVAAGGYRQSITWVVTVKAFWKNPIVAFFSSLKLSASIMAIIAFAAARATFIESSYGREASYDLVYGAHWFEGLLVLLTFSLILLFLKRWPYKPQQYGFAMIHIAMVVILLGAGATRYLGYEGTMHIREGQSVDYIYSNRTYLQATIGEQTGSFPVRLWKSGENKIWGKVTLDGKTYKLGAVEYWPHFGEAYQEGPDGIPVIQYGESINGDIQPRTLAEGDDTTLSGVEARFLTGPFQGSMSDSPLGDLRLHLESGSCSFPVAMPTGEVHTCGGYSFEITEFQADFKVGGTSSATGPLVNPMIRVKITDPQGVEGERILFAFHPDFSMGHSGGPAAFENLDMLYQVNGGLEFTRGGETGIQGRASFPLLVMDMNSQEQEDIPAGTVFPLRDSSLYGSDEMDFSFAVVKVMTSAVLAPVTVDNAEMPPAAKVVIRDQDGNQASAICTIEEPGIPVNVGGVAVKLALGSVIRKVPYQVHLDDFVLQTYPGSNNPATYESYVSLTDPGEGIKDRKVHIFMNHPMVHRGSKHFQSSYDQDRMGTVLSVNHDPGKLPTYFGYGLISLGFIIILFKELLKLLKDLVKADKKKAKEKTVKATLLALMTLGALGLHQPARAQDDGDHSGHNHPVTSNYVTLSDPVREAASRLIIQDFRGRMKPLDTLARETVMKIAKRSKFEGREPVDQYLSWSTNPDFWWDKDIIAVRFPGLKDLLGVDKATTHVSAASLFDAAGSYRLAQLAEKAHRTPDRDRTKTQRKLISFDERFQILYMTFQGTELRFFPIPGDPNHTWQSFEKVQSKLNTEQLSAYSAAYRALVGGLQSGNNAMIADGISRINVIQHEFGGEVIPSDQKIKAELIYNRAHIFSWMMIPLLAASFILMIVFFWNLFRGSHLRSNFRNPFYSLGMFLYTGAFGGMVFAYVLRWIASGRAPLSNGHESLLFISLAIALAGLICEYSFRMAAPGSLGSLLTVVILGVSMLSTFDPAIGPLVPVLVSYWLNIHVTIITSSYGFLGLSALLGALILFLIMAKGSKNPNIHEAVKILDGINRFVLIAGLGLLTIGTLLGGVWANESWGRYWGWDPKETWSFITIMVYAVVLHFRWIPSTRSIWLNSAGSMAAISSVVMTYFGVNYFLSGMHSYAQGDAATVPGWVYIFAAFGIVVIAVSGFVNKSKDWRVKG